MRRRSTCSQCGRRDDECGRISKSGLCIDCGTANARAVAEALQSKSGPIYNRYKARTEAGLARYAQKAADRIDAEARRLDQLHGNS